MNRTKNLLIGLVTFATIPAFADTKTTTSSSDEKTLEPLFKADLQYRSESESDAVVLAEGREGAYIGSGDGTVTGDRLRGTVRSSLWSQFTVEKGHVEFVDDHTVQVDGTQIIGEKILIATGSRPVIPPIEGLRDVPYMTSDLLTSGEPAELRELG